MKLTPYTKKVEIYVGYQGFYTCGREKVTITVVENGVGAIIDTRSGRPGDRGLLTKYFKPMGCLEEAKRYVETELTERPSLPLTEAGVIEVTSVSV